MFVRIVKKLKKFTVHVARLKLPRSCATSKYCTASAKLPIKPATNRNSMAMPSSSLY